MDLTEEEKSNILLIPICGGKGNGKDTIGNWCQQNLGAIRLAFGEPVKRACQQALDFTEEQVSEKNAKEAIDPYWGYAPRQFYQTLGTELFQHDLPKHLPNMNKTVWVKTLARKMARIYRSRPRVYKVFVITDIRLLHEEDFIKSFPNRVYIKIVRESANSGKFNNHRSETTLSKLSPEVIVKNNGSIQQLHKKLNFVFNTHKVKKLNLCEKMYLKTIKCWDIVKSYKKILGYLTLENLAK